MCQLLDSEIVVVSDCIPNLEEILHKVSIHTGIPVKDIKQKSRKSELVIARNIFIISAYMFTKETNKHIAGIVNRDHATTNNVRNLYSNDIKTFNDVNDFLKNQKYPILREVKDFEIFKIEKFI
jgi:chromosomal replication initiation ATPase DnaA